MERKSSDSFEIKKQNPFNSKSVKSDNFFQNEKPMLPKIIASEPARRLNDYDFNLLKEDAYKDISDDLFRLEYKISRMEEEVKNLDNQIQSANDIHDYDLAGELTGRKMIIKTELEELIEIYNDKSFSSRISSNISNLFGEKVKNYYNNIKTKNSEVFEKILCKMPKNIKAIFELKKSLEKLESINKSVDELMSFNIPYGENIDKYDKLSKYIIKANSIQADISKHIKRK